LSDNGLLWQLAWVPIGMVMWLFSNVLYNLELLKAAQTLQCTKDVLSYYGHLLGHGGDGGALLASSTATMCGCG
jgi:hypothetical protein